jgi:putative membrane protein insertion efficiency factor
MGHRNSSTHIHGANFFCSDRGGVARAVEEFSLKVAAVNVASPGVASSKKISVSRAAAWFLLTGIRFYQAVLAPLMPLGCKFYPSCSRYAAEAIARHGAKRGIRLALARLWRCRPFTQGGVDLVPDASELPGDAADNGVPGEVRW